MVDPPILSVRIADIAIGDRIGYFNAAHAERLAASMAAEGQRHPIQLKRNGNAAGMTWALVAGLHRVRGAKELKWTHINAIQVADGSATDAELRRLELAENIEHRHRRPIERSIMMHEHARLEEAVDHPENAGEASQSRAARARWHASATMADACGWRERTAAAFDISLRQFERHQRIYREICEALPDVAQELNDHPIGASLRDLERLASFPFGEQRNNRRIVIKHVLSRRDWKSLADALEDGGFKDSNGNRPDERFPDEVKFFATWNKVPPQARPNILRELVKGIRPSDVQETIDALSALLPKRREAMR